LPQFEIRRLTKTFGKTIAVDDVSFEVLGGELVGLLGPNGAGKTTTFLCAAGLLRPKTGTFWFDGHELGPSRGRTVALIPETPDVYPMLTVWEHMVFVAKSCGLSDGWEAPARELLDRFSLTDQRDKLGASLSKGMRQKTLLAATVLAGSPVILFDEPMIGIDPLGQRELREIMFDLRAKGVALMLSTHMLEQARTICDRVIILKGGQKVAEGTFDQLQAQAGSEATAEDLFLELTR
jgi:ABC-2 type transport system ATP-binding protein